MAAGISRKMQLKPGHTALVINAPKGYEGVLEPVPEDTTVRTDLKKGGADFALVFAKDSKEFDKWVEKTLKSLRDEDPVFWIAWPKKTSQVETDLTREVIWPKLTDMGLKGVANVSIDETWSAFRARK